MKHSKELKDNQQGLVAIIVTLIIMLVLTLIVTGFAQLARREQREALDRQLASQALYAAESGINAAEAVVKEELADVHHLHHNANYDNCGDFIITSDIGNSNEKPTCILVTKDPTELYYQNVQTNKSTIVPITEKSGPVEDLTIFWQNKDGGNTLKAISQLQVDNDTNIFTDAIAWGTDNVGVMRIDLVPVDTLDSSSLLNGMFTAFLIPTTNGSGVKAYSVGAGPSNQGVKIAAKCNDATLKKKCAVKITGLNQLGKTKYYLRMKSIYNVADVVVCPSDGFGCDSGKHLVGAQAIIDVTAKAADVLKRVQVRVNTDPNASGSTTIPEYTLDSAETICKQLKVTPTSTTSGC